MWQFLLWQFLQTYGIWIVLGIFFLLMMRMHLGGMRGMHSGGGGTGGGCGMGMEHEQSDGPLNIRRAIPFYDGAIESQRVIPLDDADGATRNETFVLDIPAEKEELPSNQYPVEYHTGKW